MRGFTITVIPNGSDTPERIQPVEFPQWPWFVLAAIFWSTQRHQGEYPKTAKDGHKVHLGLDARFRVRRVTFYGPTHRQVITRSLKEASCRYQRRSRSGGSAPAAGGSPRPPSRLALSATAAW